MCRRACHVFPRLSAGLVGTSSFACILNSIYYLCICLYRPYLSINWNIFLFAIINKHSRLVLGSEADHAIDALHVLSCLLLLSALSTPAPCAASPNLLDQIVECEPINLVSLLARSSEHQFIAAHRLPTCTEPKPAHSRAMRQWSTWVFTAALTIEPIPTNCLLSIWQD